MIPTTKEPQCKLPFVSASLLIASTLVPVLPICRAGDKEDKAATNALITMVENNETGQSNHAESLFLSISPDSSVQPVAAYSLALIEIREGKYSKAWKALTATPKSPESVPNTLNVGKECLKLWLLLEAGSEEKAEPQFNRLVTMSLGDLFDESDRIANCRMIGGVIGMLQSEKNAGCIASTTLEKAKELLLAKVTAKSAKTKLEEQLLEANQWGAELSAMVSKFESIGTEKAEVENRSTQAEYLKAKQTQSDLRGDLKSVGGEKQVLEDQRKKWIQNKKVVHAEMQRETPGKPDFPADPGLAPRAPTKPNGRYETDPKTKERKYIPPTNSDESQYRADMRTFDDRLAKWQQKVANYHRDRLEYQGKLQLWQQIDSERRTSLQTQLNAAEMGVKSAEKAIADLLAAMKQGVGSDLKQVGSKLDQLERVATISNLALKHMSSTEPKTKKLICPSNFQILDYTSECIRLRKSLR